MKPGQTRTIRSGTEYMKLHADGAVERTHWKPSGQWRITGAVQRNNFGHPVRFYSLADILHDPRAIPWRFKNGKQRTFLRDLDHGTPREWANPTHDVF